MRVTCTGMLYTCLGYEAGVDLRDALRVGRDGAVFNDILDQALRQKPERHDFDAERIDQPATQRTMSVTGG